MINAKYMRRAIELAQKGIGFTNPNPIVGAVIVKEGRIIGEGYHKKCGDLHAERNAFANLTEDAEGATLYVTLEPCCHYGKTPPCTEAIIENKIKKVVIGSRDPNPLVSGKGVKYLMENGIEVIEDFLKDECDVINPIFFHYITTKKPYITLKYAMTIDGKIATKYGDSKWITGELSRKEVQNMRHRHMAIMVGIGTVLADDPMLNVREEGLKSPIRVICDSQLTIPIGSKIVKSAKEYRTYIFCVNADADKKSQLESKGVNVEIVASENGRVDLGVVIKRLGDMGIDSIFVEGGAILNDSLIRAGYVDQLHAFIAPKIFGGASAKSPVEGIGISKINEALMFDFTDMKLYGDDVLLTYKRR